MGRLAKTLRPPGDAPGALLLVDEVGALGGSARHLRGLVGRAREAGLAVVLATQGPSDLDAVDRALLPQVLQDTAWQLAFRQGSPHDARQVEALFGQASIQDTTRWSDGRSSSRQAERPRVSVDEWMNALEPGDAWLRVAPIDQGWRQHRVRVALPTRKMRSEKASENASETKGSEIAREYFPNGRPDSGDARSEPLTRRLSTGDFTVKHVALAGPPPACPPELLERMGADVLAKVEERFVSPLRELGPCLVWRDGEPTIQAAGNEYGRLYDASLKRSDAAHLVVWRRCYPEKRIPKGWTLDHACYVTLCIRPDHLQGPVIRAENTRRRHARTGRPVAERAAHPCFAIALFAAVSRPRVEARVLTIEELATLLGRFEVLTDKRRGRCWSPTAYLPGCVTRGNAGVASVSALVFDCDRMPPDPERLGDVCWFGHTTWSHTPKAPRWRVVVPLAHPVPARDWADVWQRARAALCPEADPACKDPSRAYWLPSHNGGVSAKARHHGGPLLDPSTLPPPPKMVQPRVTSVPRISPGANAERYLAQVLANVAAVAPGGRNAALNHAAWTLGRWVESGKLEQREVEDGLDAAAEQTGLVADDGERQCWATIRSGLGAGLQDPVDRVARTKDSGGRT
jgi:hypothetical protein